MSWVANSQSWSDETSAPAPAVFGAEYAGSEADDVSTLIYLASQRLQPDHEHAQIELREYDGGKRAMLAYSSLEDLMAGSGEAQPWVAIKRDRLSLVQQDVGADVVLWDVDLPADVRHGPEQKTSQ